MKNYFDEREKDFTKREYRMGTDSSVCNEILIDDVYVCRFLEQANGISLPINSFLLKNGVHTITAKLYPVKPATTLGGELGKGSFLRIRLYYNPANSFSNMVLFKENNTWDNLEKMKQIASLPYYEISDTFEVSNIPEYEGWQNSKNLSKTNQDSLKQKLYDFYKDIYNIIKNKNVNAYMELIKERERLLDWTNILDNNNQKAHYNAIINALNYNEKYEELLPFPIIEATTLLYEAYGKLVSLVDKNGNGIIQLRYEDENQGALSYMNFRVHCRKHTDTLEIIF